MRRTELPDGVCFLESDFTPERWDHYWEQRMRVKRGFPHEAAMFGSEAVVHIQRFLDTFRRGVHDLADYNERTAIHMARLAGRRYIGEVLALQDSWSSASTVAPVPVAPPHAVGRVLPSGADSGAFARKGAA